MFLSFQAPTIYHTDTNSIPAELCGFSVRLILDMETTIVCFDGSTLISMGSERIRKSRTFLHILATMTALGDRSKDAWLYGYVRAKRRPAQMMLCVRGALMVTHGHQRERSLVASQYFALRSAKVIVRS